MEACDKEVEDETRVAADQGRCSMIHASLDKQVVRTRSQLVAAVGQVERKARGVVVVAVVHRMERGGCNRALAVAQEAGNRAVENEYWVRFEDLTVVRLLDFDGAVLRRGKGPSSGGPGN